MSNSRTEKSVLNAKVTLFFYFVVLLLNFFSRKVFIDYLGTEILGLNTTATSLLSFLNLAELGIGAAIAYSLYFPLFNKDHKTICEIVSIQGYWYKKIGIIVLFCSFILMLFFPLIFKKAEIPLWYTYATFIILLCGSLFSYFWNYKQIVLSADQKQYKITANRQGWMILKIILQIIFIINLENGYIYWLFLEFIFSVVMVISLNYIIKKQYPWLKTDTRQGKELQKKYPEIIIKTKQLFFHRIGAFTLSQLSPLILYFFTSLTLVSIYGNYMLIVTGLTYMLGAVFSSLNAGVGNLVAQGDRKQIMRVFWELFSFRFLCATIVCVGMYFLSTPFITLWVGREYVVSEVSLIIIISILFINITRTVIDSFINAYGLFGDVWATIVESLLNITLSIILGAKWGLDGVLLGTLISLTLIIFLWKPYFCFTHGLRERFIEYVKNYMKHIFLFGLIFYMMCFLVSLIEIDASASFVNLIIFGLIIVLTFTLIMIVSLYVVSRGMRDFVRRLLDVVQKLTKFK